MKKSVFLLSLTILFALSGCVNLVNLKPVDLSVDVQSVEQIASAAKASGNQQDIEVLAEQVQVVGSVLNESYRLQKASYDERVAGTDYDEAMRIRLEQAIPVEWKLGEEAAKLFSVASRARPELATEGMALAKAVLKLADVSDENGQFFLGYVIAGMAKDSNYLGSENEKAFDSLAQKRADAAKEADVLMRGFITHLAAVQASGAVSGQFSSDTSTSANPVTVLSDNSKSGEALQTNVEQLVAKTSLAGRHKKVSIRMEVQNLDDHTASRYEKNVATFLLIGYVDMGGGKASLSAFVQEEGSKQVPLTINSFVISAKDNGTLAKLVAYRVVGRAEMALLGEDVK